MAETAPTTAPTWKDKLVAAHTSVTTSVSHGERLKSSRYFVWQEDGANDQIGDNRHTDRAQTGHTDLYTKIEFDVWASALEAALDHAEISWELILCEYEPDTGFWHYSWDWEVLV